MATMVVNTPAVYVRSLHRRRTTAAAFASAVGATSGMFALLNLGGVATSNWTAVGVVVACAIAFVSAMIAKGQWDVARKARVGADAERRAGTALERLGPAVVLHSVVLGEGGDADHVVLGPVAVVVETKYGVGRVHVEDNKLHVGHKKMRGNPPGQARWQAKQLNTHVGCFVDAVVCVSQMSNQPFKVGDVTVCSATDLPAVVASLPHRITREKAAEVAVLLAERSGNSASVTTFEAPVRFDYDETRRHLLRRDITEVNRSTKQHSRKRTNRRR